MLLSCGDVRALTGSASIDEAGGPHGKCRWGRVNKWGLPWHGLSAALLQDQCPQRMCVRPFMRELELGYHGVVSLLGTNILGTMSRINSECDGPRLSNSNKFFNVYCTALVDVYWWEEHSKIPLLCLLDVLTATLGEWIVLLEIYYAPDWRQPSLLDHRRLVLHPEWQQTYSRAILPKFKALICMTCPEFGTWWGRTERIICRSLDKVGGGDSRGAGVRCTWFQNNHWGDDVRGDWAAIGRRNQGVDSHQSVRVEQYFGHGCKRARPLWNLAQQCACAQASLMSTPGDFRLDLKYLPCTRLLYKLIKRSSLYITPLPPMRSCVARFK